jgi:ATP-dependent Lon protease
MKEQASKPIAMSDLATTLTRLPARLPVIPARHGDLPLTLQPLAVNWPVSVDSVHRALGGDRLVFLAQQAGETEDPGPDAIRETGTVGVIRQMAKGPAATQIVVEGLVRARLSDVTRSGNVLDGAVEVRPDDETRELEAEAYVQRLRDLSDRALSFASGLPQDLKALVAGIDQPLRLCYVVASMLDMKGDDKQQLLEEDGWRRSSGRRRAAREVTLELKGKIDPRPSRRWRGAARATCASS